MIKKHKTHLQYRRTESVYWLIAAFCGVGVVNIPTGAMAEIIPSGANVSTHTGQAVDTFTAPSTSVPYTGTENFPFRTTGLGGATKVFCPIGMTCTISADGKIREIQNAADAEYNWKEFSIANGYTLKFTGGKSILNKVTGANESMIAGTLTSDGKLFLVNDNGIVITPTGNISAPSFMATSLIADGGFTLASTSYTGATKSVINNGTITVADGGVAALLGAWVSNTGTITATKGQIHMASGSTMTLHLVGSNLSVVVDTESTDVPNGKNAVNVAGTLSGDGGTVQLTAKQVASVLHSTINIDGTVQAKSVATNKQGKIILSASKVVLGASAVLDASSNINTIKGGDVSIYAGQNTDSVTSVDYKTGHKINIGGAGYGKNGTFTRKTSATGEIVIGETGANIVKWDKMSECGSDFISDCVYNPATKILTITQADKDKKYDWAEYNLKKGYTINYNVPTGGSSLNYVTGTAVSQIDGTITSNGKVFIINPNGIVFGNNSNFNVNSFMASTLDINNMDFLRKTTRYSARKNTSIVNNGRVTLKSKGVVIFVGGSIKNTGTIDAHNGSTVIFNASKSAKINMVYNTVETTDFIITLPDSVDFAIENRSDGIINANGGEIKISAENKKVILSGLIQAKSIPANEISVSQTSSQSVMGNIKILANTVYIYGTLSVKSDISGINAGEILIVVPKDKVLYKAGHKIDISGTSLASNGSYVHKATLTGENITDKHANIKQSSDNDYYNASLNSSIRNNNLSNPLFLLMLSVSGFSLFNYANEEHEEQEKADNVRKTLDKLQKRPKL